MSRRAFFVLASGVALGSLGGCGAGTQPSQTAPIAPASSNGAAPPADAEPLPASESEEGGPEPGAQVAAEPPAPVVLITEPAVLAALEKNGFALSDWLIAPGIGPTSNELLSRSHRYAGIARSIAADLADAARGDPAAGVGARKFSHRLFDKRWLSAVTARFELVGVANRFDRTPFHPGRCGEIRLVYRLAYTTKVHDTEVSSRLPMTLSIETFGPPSDDAHGCSTVAQRWQPPQNQTTEDLVAWLTADSGPLAPDMIDRSAGGHEIVVNLQEVRWPSTVRPDLGGHAEYLLRAFRLDEKTNRYQPAPLENTPDLDRLERRAALKRELVDWIRKPANLAAIDAGIAMIPEKFLATRSISVTPRGLARRKNRPFASALAAADFEGLGYDSLGRVRSAEGLLRRLDESTCAGCHESRSIAGFHLLGEDPATTPAANALASGRSAHLSGDLQRRIELLKTAAGGGAVDFAQPYPERSSFDGYGAHCGLGGDPTFRGWTCAAGLVCLAYDAPEGDPVGQCLPEEPRAAGDPCETAAIVPNRDPRRDRARKATVASCAGSAVCNTDEVGFPGGMCTEDCSSLSPSSTCGAIAVLDPFNACVARGEPFTECLAEHVNPAGLRACSATDFCRDDYLCARSGSGGACIPPYFVFQLRVDGHP